MLFKVIPILLLFGLGYLLGRRRYLSPTALAELKKLVVEIALPAALFLAFARVAFEARLLVIPLILFSANLLVLLVSRRLAPKSWSGGRFFPYLLTGFEAGMLGYAIFAAVYGQENLHKFGLVDLGQVTFVFFILVPSLREQGSQAQGAAEALRSFFKTPVILAILGGILFNQSGLQRLISGQAWYASLESALQMLGGAVAPLAALIIGSELNLQRTSLLQPLKTAFVRLLIWAPAGMAFSLLVAGPLLGLDSGYQAAVFVMAVLPPPFVIPLFMRPTNPEETAYVVNTLSLSIVATLALFTLITLLFPP